MNDETADLESPSLLARIEKMGRALRQIRAEMQNLDVAEAGLIAGLQMRIIDLVDEGLETETRSFELPFS